MKAKTDWIIHGECNTAYFHMSTLLRRSRNRISSILNDNGEWVHNIDKVRDIFGIYFKKLYQTEQICTPLSSEWDNGWCATLSREEANSIAHFPSNKEIWDALKSMKPFEAPGVDGLHVGFFQRFWLLVGDSVKRKVKNIFSFQQVPKYLNQTLIALIPKQNGPKTVSQYRHISLCNTVYNIVTKILVQRLRPLLPSLISPIQVAFLVGRRGTDNVIIA